MSNLVFVGISILVSGFLVAGSVVYHARFTGKIKSMYEVSGGMLNITKNVKESL